MSFSRMVVMLATARLRLGGQHLDAGTAVAHARERSDDDDDGDDDNDDDFQKFSRSLVHYIPVTSALHETLHRLARRIIGP